MENETVESLPSDEIKNQQNSNAAKDKVIAEKKHSDDNNTTINKTDNVTDKKVKVHFVAVGSAPLMKKTKFQINSQQRFSAVISFLRKMLKLKGEALFLYCNSAFVPSPDQLVGELNEAFSVRGELVLHYSLQEAWG